MYVVMEPIVIPVGNGRTVMLSPGPRGIKAVRKGPNKPVIDTSDEDDALRRAVPAEVLARLIAEGKIIEQEQRDPPVVEAP